MVSSTIAQHASLGDFQEQLSSRRAVMDIQIESEADGRPASKEFSGGAVKTLPFAGFG